MGKVPCPVEGCSRAYDEIDGLAHHLQQKQENHKQWDSWPSALETAESEFNNRKTAEGSNDSDPPKSEGEGSLTGQSKSPDPDKKYGEGEKPFMAAPKADPDSGTMSCPSCGKAMMRIGAKMKHKGYVDEELVEFTTDRSDMICEDCDIISDGEGMVAKGVM